MPEDAQDCNDLDAIALGIRLDALALHFPLILNHTATEKVGVPVVVVNPAAP